MDFWEKMRRWQMENRAKNDNLTLQDYQALSDKEVAKRLNQLYGILTKQYPSYPILILRSFISGLFTAFGATIGLSIFLAIVGYLLVKLEAVPVIGDWLNKSGVLDTLNNSLKK